MPPQLIDAVHAWRIPLAGTLGLLGLVLVYLRGWMRLRRAVPAGPWSWRLSAFIGGIAALWIAIWSPLAMVDHELLTVHMVQHLVLMTVAAPLILLGAPAMIMLRALSARFVIRSTGRVFPPRGPSAVFDVIAHPLVCWCAGTLVVVVWHVPAAFALAMSSQGWHAFQRATFLAAGLLFWWPVIQPWPSSAKWPRWCVPLYLFLATLPCDALSAFFAFCGRTVYPAHLCHSGASPEARLSDQVSAGALMWFWVTVAYLVPAIRVVLQILSPLGEENDAEGASALIER